MNHFLVHFHVLISFAILFSKPLLSMYMKRHVFKKTHFIYFVFCFRFCCVTFICCFDDLTFLFWCACFFATFQMKNRTICKWFIFFPQQKKNTQKSGDPHVLPSTIVSKIMERFQAIDDKSSRLYDVFNEGRPMSAPPTPGPTDLTDIRHREP